MFDNFVQLAVYNIQALPNLSILLQDSSINNKELFNKLSPPENAWQSSLTIRNIKGIVKCQILLTGLRGMHGCTMCLKMPTQSDTDGEEYMKWIELR